MKTSRESDEEPGGSSPATGSRYDSSPVGGLGGDSVTRYRGGKPGYGPKPHDSGGYAPKQPDQPPEPGGTYEQGQPPSTPGRYGSEPTEPPPTDGGTTETETPTNEYGSTTPPTGYGPEAPTGGYGPEHPPTGYGPEHPPTGYGPEDPGYPGSPGSPQGPYGPGADEHPCPPSMTCSTDGIDKLQCEAEATKAESDELAAVGEALTQRRTAFGTAREEYIKARDEATKSVKNLQRRVEDLLTDTKCLLNRDEVDCLDKAFTQVLDCLKDCPGQKGCCVADGCGFEEETWTVGQIEELRGRIEKVEKCFDDVLIKEPAALKQRVADLQKLVDDLTNDMKKDPRDDANKLYARAKQANWVLGSIWGGFKDVNEFQECLCSALTCSLRGRQWLAQLVGKKKYQECQEKAHEKRCDWLIKNMVAETLATQLILCPPAPPCGDKGEETTSTTTY